MYVKDNMIPGPITIRLDQSVSEAVDLMSENKLHRLPVVDELDPDEATPLDIRSAEVVEGVDSTKVIN